jgi:hypothetical protein
LPGLMRNDPPSNAPTITGEVSVGTQIAIVR